MGKTQTICNKAEHLTTPEENNGQCFHCEKCGTVPQKSAESFKALLPLATMQSLFYARDCFIEGAQID